MWKNLRLMGASFADRQHVSRKIIKKFEWEEWEHSPHSPDLALCNFRGFEPMKKAVGNRRYHTDKVQNAVGECLPDVGREFFNNGIEKLVSCYDKLNSLGNFVEE